MELDILREHLRQARLTFNLSCFTLALSLGISLIGGILLFTGKSTEGTVNAATGLVSATFCAQVSKDSSEKLDRLTKTLKALRSANEL